MVVLDDTSVWTVGHSNRSLEELLRILQSFGITGIADVRSVPRSRRNPQFNADALAGKLPALGLSYTHFKDLGGWRRPRPDSRHVAWQTDGFRGYADHMETDAFASAVTMLLERARDRCVAVMCAEAVPWRCHRQLLADYLLVRGVGVQHILGEGVSRPHHLTPFARVERHATLVYDRIQQAWSGEFQP